ncbi:haloacid dehalogenase superfamily, subfamily IA, variant 3 with third motif having DD or ED/haloacid dehalogenase superfamily, subfamily IA, variant 1 with third motif having Dx(3-4)D or Dx(3-4)E [Arboricoccus pini]|uniref:Haloacid dehalogenase superfamily, subfamily IA, variant 3 with third motif having DD or ED/haloacid dehalogenase superfamily, subfamily IA, variant 1 with third motif having Dx(3-4)D or Dx(3-4)E n=1 Tax=Arboricoccus pini TaxID=1963835 RepID=A0A212RZE7_9PROT|nr:HAD family phosphatase [Arboricoccus pini]SNB78006.1 haloacid dehalogenase superfamily, subfamily IA, variant 3 with third motif having DD or ED/haloacid dehalogenase superfamily, subfamily IA, variant 1 with third motif having Dx(3-4)D or Dx(3-4)E [Arboricoccus pini]
MSGGSIGVAWDIDGTLVDSEPLHERALRAVCARHGADLSDFDPDRFTGLHNKKVWAILADRLAGRITRTAWLGEIEDYYEEHKDEIAPTPNAVSTIQALAKRGVLQACVSNASRRTVDTNLAALGIDTEIAFSLSLDDVIRGKPDPAPYHQACLGLGLACSNVFAVEDSETGIASARAAGLTVLGFNGTGGRVGLADHIIDDLALVVDLIGRTRDA